MRMSLVCKFSDDWSSIGWVQSSHFTSDCPGDIVYRVTSLYDVYCNKCKKFVNLLDGKEIDSNGRVVLQSNLFKEN